MRVLIVGDLAGHLTAVSKILLDRGDEVTQVGSPGAALSLMRHGKRNDFVLMDVNFDVRGFLTSLQQERVDCSLIACGVGLLDRKKAAQVIQAGAKECVSLSSDTDQIADLLESLLTSETQTIFQDPVMKKTIRLADQVSKSEASILITGESGTGKEVIARYIHKNSNRQNKPLIAVNCAAIPDNLLESELFGHEKGSFTGALSRRIGKFEEAHGGTLLLDEISEMDQRLQAKLLRALQEREIDRVGGSKPVCIDIRVLATSNRDMRAEIAAGRFREDLYFRLNVINLALPALRNRPQDIALLAHHFMEKYLQLNALQPKEFSDAALRVLQQHSWPGNVRELENTIHRSVLLSPEKLILPEHLGLEDTKKWEQWGQTLASVERDHIVFTLEQCGGDNKKAASLLGLSLTELRQKVKEHDLLTGVPQITSHDEVA